MYQHLILKGVARFLRKPRSLGRVGSFFLCAFVFLSFSPFSPLLGQEGVIQRVTAPMTAPLQSVFAASPKVSPPPNSALPGFGTLSNDPASPIAGSLEFLPLVPTRQLETTNRTMLSLPLDKAEPIFISAQTGWHKRIGNYEVYFLRGDCSLRQGRTTASSPEAVIWIAAEKDKTTHLRSVAIYLESESAHLPVRIEQSDPGRETVKITDQKWFGHWYTSAVVDLNIAQPLLQPPPEEPAILRRAIDLMASPKTPGDGVVQVQYLSSQTTPQLSQGSNFRFRRLELVSRGDAGYSTSIVPYDPDDHARGGIAVLTGGINLIVTGIEDNTILSGSTIDLSADNAVIWGANLGRILGGSSYTESESLDFEIYLEGNIIYRDGPRVIEASRMYYDAKHKVAYILNGHLSIPITEFGETSGIEGSVRLKADILQQMGDGLFTAKNAMFTTSQLGEPTYSLRSRTLKLDQRVSQPFGSSKTADRQVVVAENNYIAARNVPVFYWPWIAADVEDPTFYIKNVSYGSSSHNGQTVKTLWNPFQILNLRRPDGVNGDVSVTWMEKRGIGHGANFRYDRPSFCTLPGRATGSFVYWGIHDRGTDRLGGWRNNVTFPHSYRYRLHWLHQQQVNLALPVAGGPWDWRAEVGKTSDRNFLNSYFHSLWNTEENATTAVDLTRRDGNQTFGMSAGYALDTHYSNANWLPRFDHYWLGQSLLSDHLTWYEHTRVGLVNYHTATTPSDGVDANLFRYLPWENHGKADGTGLAFSTRHELDLPVQAGIFKVVPYVLGDFSVWGKDQDGDAVDRLYGQAGVRVNLPLWKVIPNVSSRTWYVNGLAHKMDFDAEYLYAQANRSMDNLILTDPLDHWSIDDFRRRYVRTNPYFKGTMFSPQFDPRYYALRSGMASNVTAGNMEIADDLQMFRFGMTHRFQTKRGSVGKRRILDWITFSTHLNLYPQAEQNFGKGLGLFDYNFLWYVGDRFSLFSEGLYDFFEDGQNLTRVGGVWNRPDRGNFSLMVDQLSGVMERTYLTMRLGYTMNEKYAVSYTTSYDIRDNWQNVGHNFLFTRTGESFRLLMGASYSEALSEWSFSVGLEPVFLRQNKRTLSAL